MHHPALIILALLTGSCELRQTDAAMLAEIDGVMHSTVNDFDSTTQTIHVFVALCDNRYQGIVKVPAAIGNGQDPDNNLYWGCGYGIRTYFKRSSEWRLLQTREVEHPILERLVFKHNTSGHYLVADAYDGQFIKQCTEDFISATSGLDKDTLHVGGTIIGTEGNAVLTSYIGHNGLMDFTLPFAYKNTDNTVRDCIILACFSKAYFESYLEQANAHPLLWTSGLMCPEAYTLHDALSGYVKGESADSIRTRAALAYHKFQKCGERPARKLLVSGW